MCLVGVIWGTSTWPDGTGITAMYMAGDLLAFNSRRGWAVRWGVSAAAQGMLRSKGRDIKVLCVVIRDGAFHPNRSKMQGYKHKLSVLPWPTRSMQGCMCDTHKSTECTKMTIIHSLAPGPDPWAKWVKIRIIDHVAPRDRKGLWRSLISCWAGQ